MSDVVPGAPGATPLRLQAGGQMQQAGEGQAESQKVSSFMMPLRR